eukprot:CAMPEP_0206495204 /NCGR_PEP_ID=MMETSP0324_2-20121206/48307_1 /ASSEMBLY_ACC=CAM_ASM_000836 /TAXON_ID=2866 /ORGANISM="Crypthecodinium cohnii, Strain Seligo" /LENGTH=222 /DNA_ID=CAMNT_0053979251 /DNA_START=32 /DNA_END=700 /DNA_ORIENTATION=-
MPVPVVVMGQPVRDASGQAPPQPTNNIVNNSAGDSPNVANTAGEQVPSGGMTVVQGHAMGTNQPLPAQVTTGHPQGRPKATLLNPCPVPWSESRLQRCLRYGLASLICLGFFLFGFWLLTSVFSSEDCEGIDNREECEANADCAWYGTSWHYRQGESTSTSATCTKTSGGRRRLEALVVHVGGSGLLEDLGHLNNVGSSRPPQGFLAVQDHEAGVANHGRPE